MYRTCSVGQGKDRLSNIRLFEEIVKKINAKNTIRVISNDKELIYQSTLLKQYYKPATSIQDFNTLIHADNIYTQMSGFCVAPFLMSEQSQCLYLLDKTLHNKKDYPFLDKDWKFFKDILQAKVESNKNKRVVSSKTMKPINKKQKGRQKSIQKNY